MVACVYRHICAEQDGDSVSMSFLPFHFSVLHCKDFLTEASCKTEPLCPDCTLRQRCICEVAEPKCVFSNPQQRPCLYCPLLLHTVRYVKLFWCLKREDNLLLHLNSSWPSCNAGSLTFSRKIVPLTGRWAAVACWSQVISVSSMSGYRENRTLEHFDECVFL